MKQKNVILMVVAVGCGLVAALLTSQMSARTPTQDLVQVIVAAKDLPVGTQITKEVIKEMTTMKGLPKDSLPPAYVQLEEELLEKRLARGVRKGETFNPADLSKGGVVTLPPGMSMVSMSVGAANAVAGFVGPGARVDILSTLRLQNRLLAFPLMTNMLILAIDTQTVYDKSGVFPAMSTVSFAVDRKQALLLSLAKSRGCTMELLLRNPEDPVKTDERFTVENVTKLLQDETQMSKVISGINDEDHPVDKPRPTPPKGSQPETAPATETVQVPVATEEIAAGTELTADLIAAKFKPMALPTAIAEGAVTDLKTVLGKTLTSGLGKNQWLTMSRVGEQGVKPSPQTPFVPEKGGVSPAPKRNTHDVVVHTSSGSKSFRYEEVRAGEWKLVGEVRTTTNEGGDDLPPPKPDTKPEAKPDDKKVD
jgi:pilus assembly protein CpaB